jgi:putative transcriptional regulator
MSSLAGCFLVAKSVLQDPSFRRTVVLLLRHGEEGAFGLIVNRPASVDGLTLPAFAGGPCSAPGLLLLHGHREWLKEGVDEAESRVAPGIFMGGPSCVDRIDAPEPGSTARLRIFVGYAGWGPGQLEGELEAGAWAIEKATGDLLFGVPPEDLWARLAPPTIPQPSLN